MTAAFRMKGAVILLVSISAAVLAGCTVVGIVASQMAIGASGWAAMRGQVVAFAGHWTLKSDWLRMEDVKIVIGGRRGCEECADSEAETFAGSSDIDSWDVSQKRPKRLLF